MAGYLEIGQPGKSKEFDLESLLRCSPIKDKPGVKKSDC